MNIGENSLQVNLFFSPVPWERALWLKMVDSLQCSSLGPLSLVILRATKIKGNFFPNNRTSGLLAISFLHGYSSQLKMDFHDCDWQCGWRRWYVCLPLLPGVFPQSAQVMRTGTHVSGIGQHCGIIACHTAWYVQLILEQHGLELFGSTSTQIFFTKYSTTVLHNLGWILRCGSTQLEGWLYIYMQICNSVGMGPLTTTPPASFKV